MSAAIIDVWFSKLARLIDLDDAELAALRELPFTPEDVPASRYLVREGEHISRCCLLIKGYVARHKLRRDGSRQIVSFQLPGDMLDLQHCLLSRADHNLQSMTPGSVAWVPIAALSQVASTFPRIATAFAKNALIDASIFREWILNIGTRDAKTRVAHVLCEFVHRREALGIGPLDDVHLPFSQEQLGDATGLTAVHVNRMLRELSEEGAFARSGRSFRITDWKRFKALADFDPSYLHMPAMT